MSDASEDDSSLDDIYFKNKSTNNDYDEDIDNFDVNNYLNSRDTDNTNYTELKNKFWSRICLALNQINFNCNFCDPLNDFPFFIKSLYNIKDELDPVNKYYNLASNRSHAFTLNSCVNSIIKIISKYSMNSDPKFIIWDLPEALNNDNFIYFSVLLELSDTNNSIWINFSKTPGSLNLLFDHYLPLIGPSSDIVTAQLITLIDSLFRNPELYENIKMPKKQANNFWFKLMRIIGCSENVAVITTAFCIAKSLYLQMTPLMQKNVKIDWLNNLIDASSNGTTNSYREFYKISSDYEIKTNYSAKNRLYSPFEYKKANEQKKVVLSYRYCPVHYQVLEFIFSLNTPNFKYVTLCKNLIHQGISSPDDLFYIQRCLMVPKIKKPFLGLKFLLKVSTTDKIWSSLATQMLYEPLLRFSKLGGVQTLLSEYVRRCFIFIGVASLRQKYGRKRMMILNSFRALYCDVGLDWLNSIIMKYYAALVFSKKMKHVIPDFSLRNQKKGGDSESDEKGTNLKKVASKQSIASSLSNDSVGSIKSSHSNFDVRLPSFPDFDNKPRRSPEIKGRVEYDKMFPNEIDRLNKSQIDLKNYLKTNDIVIPKFVNKKTKTKIQNSPYQANQERQKAQVQKQKLNGRLYLQRQQMLAKYRQQKEAKEQKTPKMPQKPIDSHLKSKLQQQQQQYLRVQKIPKSQMNQCKPSNRLKPKTPPLIQPTIRQVQQQKLKKKQKMEIQKIELIDKPLKYSEDNENKAFKNSDEENKQFKNSEEEEKVENNVSEGEYENDDDEVLNNENEEDDDEEDEEENVNENNENGTKDDDDDEIDMFFSSNDADDVCRDVIGDDDDDDDDI